MEATDSWLSAPALHVSPSREVLSLSPELLSHTLASCFFPEPVLQFQGVSYFLDLCNCPQSFLLISTLLSLHVQYCPRMK